MSISELDRLVGNAVEVAPNAALTRRANAALDLADRLVAQDHSLVRSTCLAAFFDLLVAEEYYSLATAANWIGCPNSGLFHYAYTHACPGCLEIGEFHHVAGKKPSSATVGKVVAHTLRTFIGCHVHRLNHDYSVLHAVEPMDLMIVSKRERRVFAGEIKAAPLLTLPLNLDPRSVGKKKSTGHARIDLPARSAAFVQVPQQRVGASNSRIPVFEDGGVWDALQDEPEVAKSYVLYWAQALDAYSNRGNAPVRWLSNGCGAPPSGTPGWPSRDGGGGPQSISDGKSSVGMDRTDDLKKAVYQLLKIGVELREGESEYILHTGIVSNIHPIKHGPNYIYPMLDVVWGHGSRGAATGVNGVEQRPAEMHYLIDGLIALTEQRIQDPWVKKVFSL